MSRKRAILTICAFGAFIGALLSALDTSAVQTAAVWVSGFLVALSLTGLRDEAPERDSCGALISKPGHNPATNPACVFAPTRGIQ